MDKIQVRKEQELEMLSQMLLIRRFEERAAQQYQRGDRIGGFCHLYIGQEAVIAGTRGCHPARTITWSPLTATTATHLARGTSADSCMAELFGKATGCSKGSGRLDALLRQGTLHDTAGTLSSASTCRWPRGLAFAGQVPRRGSSYALLHG